MTLKYPNAFLNDMASALGDEYQAFESALYSEPAASLRINPKRSGVGEALGGITTGDVPWEKNGRYVFSGFHPGNDPVHFAGGYYMQEASAMAPAAVLNVKPYERALDLCAAPGGKSGQIAAALMGTGVLVSNEPVESRARMLAGNMERLGVTNCCVVSERPAKLADKWPETFDAVMVDAPCSGEGMFRRDEMSRAEWSPERKTGCAERQREILLSAVEMLKPMGRLLYSTCTFNSLEDEQNALWLERNTELEPVDFELPGVGASNNGCIKLWPHRVRGEGQFAALFIKRAPSAKRQAAKASPYAASKQALAALGLLNDALGCEIKSVLNFDTVKLSGDTLWGTRRDFPDLSGVRTFMEGVRLARVKSGYAIPDHALAMALDAGKVSTLELDGENALAFMRGEEVPSDLSGWTLAAYRGMPLGFGKCSQGRMRNHLPKGLRIRG